MQGRKAFRWIDIKKQLPPVNTRVLVCGDNLAVIIDVFSHDDFEKTAVSHWAPLPELPVTEKKCVKCGRVKLMEKFKVNRASVDGRSSYCCDCWHAYNVAYIRKYE